MLDMQHVRFQKRAEPGRVLLRSVEDGSFRNCISSQCLADFCPHEHVQLQTAYLERSIEALAHAREFFQSFLLSNAAGVG